MEKSCTHTFNGRLWASLFALLLLMGCGGSGNGSGSDLNSDTNGGDTSAPIDSSAQAVGYLVDSAVGNLTFSANGIDGETNAAGQFEFNVGEPVTFTLAGLDLGTVTLSETNTVITPAELRGETRDSETYSLSTRNLLRLLQTLDRDGNPANGINLPTPTELEDNGLSEVLSGQQLNDPSFDTQIASALTDLNAAFGTASELVDEAAALEHFDLTLEGLKLPASLLTLSDGTVSKWDIYSENFADFSGRITFIDSVSGTFEDWNNCSGGDDEETWIGTLTRAEALCSNQNLLDITWQIDGQTFTYTSSAFQDTCTIISGDRHRFTASCDIDLGNDRQIEIQYFVRVGVDRFNEQLLTGDFTEFSGGGHNISDSSSLKLEADKTGSYKVLSNQETGNFTWSLGNNASELLLAVDGESGPVDALGFLGYFAGSFHTFGNGDMEETAMILNYRPLKSTVGSVFRYQLPEGTPLGIVDVNQNNTTGELLFDDEGKGYDCGIIHSIKPIIGSELFWVDCTSDESAGRSFELWRK